MKCDLILLLHMTLVKLSWNICSILLLERFG